MTDNLDLYNRIKQLFPDLDASDIDLKVDKPLNEKRWRLTFTKDDHSMTAFLDQNDVNVCMQGGKCVDLFAEVAHFRAEIENSVPGN